MKDALGHEISVWVHSIYDDIMHWEMPAIYYSIKFTLSNIDAGVEFGHTKAMHIATYYIVPL